MMKIFTFFTILLILFSFQINAQEYSLRINTGSSEVDYNDEIYMVDAHFDTGSTLVRPQTGLPEPYQSFRYSPSQQMSYAIPLADGEYTINLHFAELWFGATGGGIGEVGKRVFDVSLEGQLAEDNLDVFAEVGAEAKLVKSHMVTVTDGVLDIYFDSRDAVGGERHPVINAIEIIGVSPVEPIISDLTLNLDDGFLNSINLTSSRIMYSGCTTCSSRLVANVNEGVGSVHLVLNGPISFEETTNGTLVDSQLIFEGGDHILPPGAYTLTATPYSAANKGGEMGQAITTTLSTQEGIFTVLGITDAMSCTSADGGVVISTDGSIPDNSTWSHDPLLNGSAFSSDMSPGNYQVIIDWGNSDVVFDYEIKSMDGEDCPDLYDFALRINTGGSEVDYNGETFMVDSYFDTGSTLVRPHTGLPEPYQSFRFSRSQQMSYDIPLEDGEYTVNLYFAELWFGATGGGVGGVGSRVFDVNIEGALAVDNLDIFAEVGAEAMLMKSHTVTVTGGVLEIDFDSRDAVGGERHPVINAIEILSQVSEPTERPFITTWKTDINQGYLEKDDEVSILTCQTETYNYSVEWGDGATSENVTGDLTHTYDTPGTYTVSIRGDFPCIRFIGNTGDSGGGNPASEILSIDQWGDIEWRSMANAFSECESMDVVAADTPNLSNVESMSRMFYGCFNLVGTAAFNDWNVSNVSNMSGMFQGTLFNLDIGDWDVSNVTDLSSMFWEALNFNQYIGDWDVTKVTNMSHMFFKANAFNQDLGGWDVSSVTGMRWMFNGAAVFNQDIADWDVSNVTDLGGMFSGAAVFNKDIGGWHVSNVANMSGMFSGAEAFNQDIGGWGVSTVTSMSGMFSRAEAFNQDIGGWDVSNVSGMSGMFRDANVFNQDIGNWVVSNVTDTFEMFRNANAFNQDIGDWDVSNVTKMFGMFLGANAFNQAIGDWDVSKVSVMDSMFDGANTFNQDISGWNVSKVNSMDSMFRGAENFNQDIGGWDVSGVKDMDYMFYNADAFNQNLGSWDVSHVAFASNPVYRAMNRMFTNSGLSNQNYDKTLIGWSQLPSLQNGVRLDAPQNQYCDAEQARQHIINNYGWIITDAGIAEDCGDTTSFVTTWKTDNEGFSEDNQITIPTVDGQTYNYSVDWGDGTTSENVTGKITHTYATIGTYSVSIAGDFPRLQFFPNSGAETDYGKLLTIEQWGDLEWTSMFSAFMICYNLDVLATDVPNLSNVESMSYIFNACESLVGNATFGDWDVSNVTDMSWMFQSADAFNQDIGDWDVSNVTDMEGMFSGSKVFNQDIGDWNVSSVSDMDHMFTAAENFNQDIGEWNVFNVTDMSWMLYKADAFNQDIGDWNVSNVTHMNNMFLDSGFSDENYNKALIGWSLLPSLQSGVTLDAPQNQYCLATYARNKIIDDFSWVINDAGQSADCPDSNGFVLRINAGGNQVDYNNETFIADTYFDTGSTLVRPQTGLPEPYQSFRYSPSQQMSYKITVPDGEYLINLHFAELWFGATGGGAGGVGSRVFDVTIEGFEAEDNLDVFAAVGAETMMVRAYVVIVIDGFLNIDFSSLAIDGGQRHPIINAIEIFADNQNFSGKSSEFTKDEDNDMIIYPNQVSDFAIISFEKPTEVEQIYVYDVSGRLVRTFKAADVSADGAYNLKVNDLESGTYFINALDSKGVNHQKQMVIKR